MSLIKIPIIMGSNKDLKHANALKEKVDNFSKTKNVNVRVEIRVCSAHKNAPLLMSMLEKYEVDESVLCMVTIAGKSNALSACVCGHTRHPVIAYPPVKYTNMVDIYSSINMPSGVAPMLVLGAENVFLSLLKIMSLRLGETGAKFVQQYQQHNKNKLRIQDIVEKYNCADIPSEERTEFTDMEFVRNGKVRDIYRRDDSSDTLVLSATNRLTSFDRYMCDVEYKGQILNKISLWWFKQLRHLVPNHLFWDKDLQTYKMLNDHSVEVKKCVPFKIEFVMRSYLTGSTNTSIWKNYEKGVREYCGHHLEDGMVRNQKLPKVLLTPTTKDEHDELISARELIEQGYITQEEWDMCEEYSHKIFAEGQRVAAEKGMILVDTKYEFGKTSDGQIVLIDEVHTPDSSRYWFLHNYEERFVNQQEPESIDKEAIRKWVRKNYEDPYDLTTEIVIPQEMVDLVQRRYMQLYEIITSEVFSF